MVIDGQSPDQGAEDDDRRYTCPIDDCQKVFTDYGSYRKHQMTHGERMFICQVQGCNKKFLDNSKLKRHQLVHTGEKPYKCEICGKRFSLDFNLRTHLRTHTGEKPYVCSFQNCYKRFTQSSNLTAHEKTHLTKEFSGGRNANLQSFGQHGLDGQRGHFQDGQNEDGMDEYGLEMQGDSEFNQNQEISGKIKHILDLETIVGGQIPEQPPTLPQILFSTMKQEPNTAQAAPRASAPTPQTIFNIVQQQQLAPNTSSVTNPITQNLAPKQNPAPTPQV